jgi:hypothetical protein
MKTYLIKKSYDSRPSKNHTEETGLSYDDAVASLNYTAKLWSKNSGEIVSHTADELIVAEQDESETITFSIEEIED